MSTNTPTANRLQEVLRVCKGSFFAVGFFSLFVNLLMLVPAFYMLQVYGRVVTSGSIPTLVMLTIIMSVLMITMGLLEWTRSRIMVRISAKIDEQLSPDVYNASFKRALASGGMDASAQPLGDLNGLRQFMTGNGLFAFFDAPWLPIYIWVMFLFNPLFGWFAIGAAVVLVILAIFNERFTAKTLAQANGENQMNSLTTTKNLRNAEVIESMGMLHTLRSRWMERQERVIALQSMASDKAGIITSMSKTFRQLVQSLILGAGAYLAINQEISPGLMIAGSLLLGRALAPIDLMIGTWKGFVAARGQYERLTKVLTDIQNEPERMSLPDPTGQIAVEQLVVAAPGQKQPILKGLNFAVPANTVVGIIGPSASGKSTLARAMLGVWQAQHGAVRLDGAEIAQWDKAELGPHIGYLPQDIELFEGSISENIARFGEVNAEKVILAARQAGVHEMILQLEEGYDTVIGSTGTSLSGGQRQRIGLARALYGEPRLIVLDEPNSNLDEVGERALAQAIMAMKAAGSSVFIITHRTSVLSQVDMLLVFLAAQVGLLQQNTYGYRLLPGVLWVFLSGTLWHQLAGGALRVVGLLWLICCIYATYLWVVQWREPFLFEVAFGYVVAVPVVYLLSLRPPRSVSMQRVQRLAGAYSYPLFLIHLPIIWGVQALLGPSSWAWLWVVMGSLLFAVVVHHGVELRMWRRLRPVLAL